jgi:hypothetical protein
VRLNVLRVATTYFKLVRHGVGGFGTEVQAGPRGPEFEAKPRKVNDLINKTDKFQANINGKDVKLNK